MPSPELRVKATTAVAVGSVCHSINDACILSVGTAAIVIAAPNGRQAQQQPCRYAPNGSQIRNHVLYPLQRMENLIRAKIRSATETYARAEFWFAGEDSTYWRGVENASLGGLRPVVLRTKCKFLFVGIMYLRFEQKNF